MNCKECGEEIVGHPFAIDFCCRYCWMVSRNKNPKYAENRNNNLVKWTKDNREEHANVVRRALKNRNPKDVSAAAIIAWNNKERRDAASIRAIARVHNPNDKFGKPNRVNMEIKYNGMKFRSSWEVDLAKLLDNSMISWSYEGVTFKLSHERYTPDFFITNLNLFIEIKPTVFCNSNVVRRIKEVRAQGNKIILLTEKNWDKVTKRIISLNAVALAIT